MSRIGKLPVPVPSGVDVTIDGQQVIVKGPKGTLSHIVAEPITVDRAEDGTINVLRPDDERLSKSLHGLSRTLIANMVTGVTSGYSKTLEIVGTGYRVVAKGSDLEFALGFSHPVLAAPVRADRRRQHGHDARFGVDVQADRRRQDRAVEGGGCGHRVARPGRRGHQGRVRPRWQHLHRPDRGVRRRGPRSRIGVLSMNSSATEGNI